MKSMLRVIDDILRGIHLFSTSANTRTGASVRHGIHVALFFLAFAKVGATPSLALAAYDQKSNTARLCDNAALAASQKTGVPLQVLLAITRTETGRATQGVTEPWPWTVNMEGRGLWFDTRAAAQVYVFDYFKTGARSFDIGCFQINYRWHGAQFASIEDMFDPLENALYAASFLATLHQETGDWNLAVARYHSRTAVHADRYMVRFDSIVDELSDRRLQKNVLSTPHPPEPRENRFMLLQPGKGSGLASLVPLHADTSSTPVIDLRKGSGG